jgi:hypothetical protein
VEKTSKSAAGALKGRGFKPRRIIVFKDLRHGWEAVPLQNSDAESFSASSEAMPFHDWLDTQKTTGQVVEPGRRVSTMCFA